MVRFKGPCGRRKASIRELTILLLIPLTVYLVSYYDIVRRLGTLHIQKKTPVISGVTLSEDGANAAATAAEQLKRDVLPEPPVLKSGCELPELIYDGVPWPNCHGKIAWMKHGWKNDPCYANHGVSDDVCSIITYLSTIERHCPRLGTFDGQLEPLYLKGEKATIRKSFDHLYNELGNIEDYSWMKKRIQSMEMLWKSAAADVLLRAPARNKKRIHLHLGLMRLGLGKDATNGGPLGELVQWSDLIASLYIMGHDIVLTRTKQELSFVYDEYVNKWILDCPTPSRNHSNNIPFDIVYTDITGYKDLVQVIKGNKFDPIRCRLRVVDSFGTEAAFNDRDYAKAKSLPIGVYSGLNLNLQQFNTMFPHTPDNTFLGFVTEDPSSAAGLNFTATRDIALVYGKLESFWEGKQRYIDIVSEYVSEVHATVKDPKDIPTYIINHGVLPVMELFKLLHRTKIFVGLGFPFEGPAPLEAIQQGAVFLNPRFDEPVSSENHEFYKAKPTRRKVTSQNPYVEKYVGKPFVYTVNASDETSLREALDEIMKSPEPGGYIPREFSAKGMLERLSVQVEKQQFCLKVPYASSRDEKLRQLWWPPLRALRVLAAPEPGPYSCNDVCDGAGLICEPSFFPVLNRKEAFEVPAVGFSCETVKYPISSELDYPAYDRSSKTCYLQTNDIRFSCAGNYMGMQRLCPCRDFVKGQIALCKDC